MSQDYRDITESYEEDEPDSDQEGGHYRDNLPALPTIETVAKVTRSFNSDGSIKHLIKATKSDFVHNLVYLDGAKFDFTGREYLFPLYNRKDQDILLKTARQVEKCGLEVSEITMKDGTQRRLKDVVPGDHIIAMGPDGHQTVDQVIASQTNGNRPCLRLRTRLGSEVIVTRNHPLRVLNRWINAEEVRVGDKIASLRRIGEFGTHSLKWAGLIGLMLGDGHILDSQSGGSVGFTQKNPDVNKWFGELLAIIGDKELAQRLDQKSGSTRWNLSQRSNFAEWCRGESLMGCVARHKRIPAVCFSFDRESSRDLLRGLWATDGHCKNVTKSKVDLVYCTTSSELAKQVRLLLRKFGVVTVIRENRPSNGGRLAYLVRVVTRRSIEAFHREVGPIPGKPFSVPEGESSSNLDTLPKEVHGLVVSARKANGTYWQRSGFQASGQRINRSYCPTFEKIAAQNELLKDDALSTILNADIIWDEVVSAEDIGEHPTWGIQTHTHTYISDFIVNHNTTFLANNLVVSSVVQPYNKSLYVSPSHTQTRQFSNEKLRPAIEKSPFVKKYFQDHSVSTQVFEKGFTNGSYVFLRSAFRSADRTRGISARNLCYDKDAEVLSRKGWIKASSVTVEDELADVNDVGVVEWNRPTQIISKSHSGKMVTFSHGSFHLRVTEDHRMWANFKVKASPKYKQEDKYEFISAGELASSPKMGFKMGCAAEWPSTGASPWPEGGKPLVPLCALIGWYLADGYHCGGYACLSISVKKLVHVLPILEELGLPYNIYNGPKGEGAPSRVVWVMNKSLGDYLKALGKAYDKHIPREIFEVPEGLEALLEGLYRGDASYHEGENWEHGTLRTRSRQLAEDVQEAWLRLKRPAALHTRMSPNKAINLTPGAEYELVPLYEVCSYDIDYMIFWRADQEKRVRVEEVVDEQVYCFTVKNHRPIVKGRHDSKPIICGQCLDEIQDMLGSEIPVIMECTSHFPDANRLMAGTPKSLDNPIETYWQETSQNEWLVPCGCGKWNFLDEANIAPTEMYTSGKLPPGPVCKKCMKPLNVRAGRWMTTCSGKMIQGYRIPQLMVPWIIGLRDQWMRILWKRDNYPLGQLYNEVLGISYDSASKPITRSELIELCAPYDLWDPENLTPEVIQESHSLMLTAGIDWGEGNDGSEKSPTGKIRNASYTVLTIGAYLNQKTWAVKLVKKYEGREVDPDHIVKDIARICRTLNVQLVGVDWGHGWGVNNHLTRLLVPRQGGMIDAVGRQKVIQFQYLPKLKQRMKWDPTGYRYHLSRNFMMSELFFDMKHGFIQFPRWTQIERFAKDILAIFAEYSEFRREMKYDHRSTDPDDWFHSLHYAKLASDILTGKSRRYTLDIPQE